MAHHPHRSRAPGGLHRHRRADCPWLLRPDPPPRRAPKGRSHQNRPGQLHHRRPLPDPAPEARRRPFPVAAPYPQGHGGQGQRGEMGGRDPSPGDQADRGRAERRAFCRRERHPGGEGIQGAGRTEADRGLLRHGGWERCDQELGGGGRRGRGDGEGLFRVNLFQHREQQLFRDSGGKYCDSARISGMKGEWGRSYMNERLFC